MPAVARFFFNQPHITISHALLHTVVFAVVAVKKNKSTRYYEKKRKEKKRKEKKRKEKKAKKKKKISNEKSVEKSKIDLVAKNYFSSFRRNEINENKSE